MEHGRRLRGETESASCLISPLPSWERENQSAGISVCGCMCVWERLKRYLIGTLYRNGAFSDDIPERLASKTHTHVHTRPHRCVLTLHWGAVEAQGRNAVLAPLDGQQTLIPSLTRLGLGEVLRPESDGLHHVHRHQDPVCRQQLGTSLEEKREDRLFPWVLSSGVMHHYKWNGCYFIRSCDVFLHSSY